MSEKIKVVSFNIEYCASITKGYWQYILFWWKYFIPHNINAIWQIADLVNRENVDICTFTEIDGGSARTRHKNYLKILSQLTNLKNNAFFPVHKMWWNLANQGNGIITRYRLLEVNNVKLKTRGENRYLSIAKLELPSGKIMHVMTTQLALGKLSRAKELMQIKDIINGIKDPLIFTGDLNTHNDKELEVFKETRLKRIETPQTFPSWAPSKRLDYIYYSPEFEVVQCRVLEDMKVSDHLAVVAEFRLKQ